MIDPISSNLNHSIEILRNLTGAPKASDVIDAKETKRTAAKETKDAPAQVKARSGFWTGIAKFLGGSPPTPSKTITKNLKLIQKNIQQANKEIIALETTINSFNKIFFTNKENSNISFSPETLNTLNEKLKQARNALSTLTGSLQTTSVLEAEHVQLLENCKSAVKKMTEKVSILSLATVPKIFQEVILRKFEKDFRDYETSSRKTDWKSEASHNQIFSQYKNRLATLEPPVSSPLYIKYKELEKDIEAAKNRFRDNEAYRAEKIKANIEKFPLLLGNKLPKDILNILPRAMKDPASNDIIEALMEKGKNTPLSISDIRNLEKVMEFVPQSYANEEEAWREIDVELAAQKALEELISSYINDVERAFNDYKKATNPANGRWMPEESLSLEFRKFSQQLLALEITSTSPHFGKHQNLLYKIEEAQNRYANDAEYRNAKIEKSIGLFALTMGKKLPKEVLAALPVIMKNANSNQKIESLIARDKETTISTVDILNLMELFDKAKKDEIMGPNASYEDIKKIFDPGIREIEQLAINSINKSLQNSTVKKVYSKFTALVGPNYPFPLKQKFALIEAIKADPAAMEEFVDVALKNKKSALRGKRVPGMSTESMALQDILTSKLEGFAPELFPMIMLFRIKAGESVNLQFLTDSMRYQLAPTAMTPVEIRSGPTFRYLQNLEIGKKKNLLLTIPAQERRFAQDGYIRSALNHHIWEKSSWQEEPPLVFKWTASLIAKGKQPIHSTAILDLRCLNVLPEENKKALFFFIHDWINASPKSRIEIEKKLDEEPLRTLIPAEIHVTFMESLRDFSHTSAQAIVDIYVKIGEKQSSTSEAKVSEFEAQNAIKNKRKNN